MIKHGKVVVIGDEVLEAIALAAGIESYVFKDCGSLRDWIDQNISSFEVVIYLDTVKQNCRDTVEYMENKWPDKVYLMLDHPLTSVQRDPKEYYRELARKILGVEIVLEGS